MKASILLSYDSHHISEEAEHKEAEGLTQRGAEGSGQAGIQTQVCLAPKPILFLL